MNFWLVWIRCYGWSKILVRVVKRLVFLKEKNDGFKFIRVLVGVIMLVVMFVFRVVRIIFKRDRRVGNKLLIWVSSCIGFEIVFLKIIIVVEVIVRFMKVNVVMKRGNFMVWFVSWFDWFLEYWVKFVI